MSSKTRVLALLDDDDIKHIDAAVESGIFATRVHYIRRAIKFFRENKDGSR